jgi:hypothetical protein
MAFREVPVTEIREVLRAWLAGAGLRGVAEQAGADRKTARRYVQAAATACRSNIPRAIRSWAPCTALSSRCCPGRAASASSSSPRRARCPAACYLWSPRRFSTPDPRGAGLERGLLSTVDPVAARRGGRSARSTQRGTPQSRPRRSDVQSGDSEGLPWPTSITHAATFRLINMCADQARSLHPGRLAAGLGCSGQPQIRIMAW